MLAAFDCETTGLNLFHGDMPFMCCITFEDRKQLTFEWLVDPFTRRVTYDLDDLVELVGLFSNQDYIWVGHNSKFDTRCIEVAIVNCLFDNEYEPGKRCLNSNKLKAIADWSPTSFLAQCHDTVLMAHLYDNLGSHGLKDLGIRFLSLGEDDVYTLYQDIKRVIPFAQKYGWKYACPAHCPLVKKKPNDGWEVMDMWLPRAFNNYQLSLLGEPPSPQKAQQFDPNGEAKEAFENHCRRYCLRDTERTIRLFEFFEKELIDADLWQPYLVNRNMLEVTYAMERDGVSVNGNRLESEYKRLHKLSKTYEAKAKRLANRTTLSLTSPEQIAKSLSIDFGVKIPRRTKDGKLTIDQKELEDLYRGYSSMNLALEGDEDMEVPNVENLPYIDPNILDKLLEFLMACMASKRCATAADNYLDSYRQLMLEDILYPSYNITGTSTTRFSSSNPNGQNISKGKTAFATELQELSLSLRKVFGPSPGRKWWSVDYKQLQLVIFGAISNEEEMMSAVSRGEDFHDFTTRAIFDIPTEATPTDAQRTIGKNVNFGYLFGAGPAKIEKTARMPGLYDIVTHRFPAAHKFIKTNIKEVKDHGYVYAYDYRLYVDSGKAYSATNYKVQGWEGLIVKLAMWRCYLYLLEHPELDTFITLNVHDELVFDTPENTDECYLDVLMDMMEEAGRDRGIPCQVDAKIHYDNWAEGVKYERGSSPPF